MATTGRKTILNQAMFDAIVDLLKRGNYVNTTARAVGIDPSNISVWVKKGRDLEALDRELDETEQMFVLFSHEVEKARAFAEVQNVEVIRKASQDNWTAAAWWLERTSPQNWGRVQRTEITGANGGAIEVDVEAVNRKIEAMLANRSVVEAQVVEDNAIESPTMPQIAETSETTTE